jgi:pilus assembly protein Flp/PilA
MPGFVVSLYLRVWTWARQDDGQGLTEYALILALIAIVAIASLHFLGNKVTDALSTVASSVNT